MRLECMGVRSIPSKQRDATRSLRLFLAHQHPSGARGGAGEKATRVGKRVSTPAYPDDVFLLPFLQLPRAPPRGRQPIHRVGSIPTHGCGRGRGPGLVGGRAGWCGRGASGAIDPDGRDEANGLLTPPVITERLAAAAGFLLPRLLSPPSSSPSIPTGSPNPPTRQAWRSKDHWRPRCCSARRCSSRWRWRRRRSWSPRSRSSSRRS